jgi:adenylate cyclase
LQQQALAIAKEKRDAAFLMWAHNHGFILCPMGEFTSARTHLERGISLYDSALSEAYRAVYPVVDPGVVSLGWLALTLCLLGYPDQALERGHQAVALARKLAHPLSLALTRRRSSQFYHLRREGKASLSSADECLRLATEYGFEETFAPGPVGRGCALIELNRMEEGIVELEDGIAAARAMGYEFCLTHSLAALGNGYAKVGRVADGLSAVAEGLAVSEKNGERWFDAELYRVRGELLLKHDAHAEPKAEEAETCFRQALDIARAQEARWWELRASVSLARLLARTDRRAEACAMLADIYNWFTEGFDTVDLKDAKALLEELGA